MTYRSATSSLVLALSFCAALVSLASCSAPVGIPEPGPTGARLDRASAAPVHLVTGGGKLGVSNFDPTAPSESYAFSATVAADGDVRGQMQIRFNEPLVTLHADVTCLAVAGRDAWIGIVVTKTDDPGVMPVGAEWWVRVQDNGEGAASPADRMGFFIAAGGAARCNERRPVRMPFAWLDGNIQVR